jgi:hypothetical protein
MVPQKAFVDSAAKGNAQAVREALAWEGPDGQRVDPTAESNYAVWWAAGKGHVEVV